MKMAAFILTIVLAGSACLAPADDAGDSREPEPVVEASAALTTAGATSDDPDPSEWMRRNVPIWNAYIGGLGKDTRRTHPDDNDLRAPIIFVRAGDEAAPERWIELRLWYHWMIGDAYFVKLVGCGLLSPLDLLSMRAALRAYDDRKTIPPSIFTLPAATRDAVLALDQRSRAVCPGSASPKSFKTFYEERGDFNPFPGIIPGPNNDHTGPAPGGHEGGSPIGKPIPKPTPKPAPSQTSLSQQRNGVFRGDPSPVPFESPSYTPGPLEREETFRCEGVIYRGYKAGCVDFSNDSTRNKWSKKMDGFTGSYFAQNGQPSQLCEDICDAVGASPGLLSIACAAGTIEVAGVPCWYFALGAWTSGVALPKWCKRTWCTARAPVVSRHECKSNPDGKSMTCNKVQ